MTGFAFSTISMAAFYTGRNKLWYLPYVMYAEKFNNKKGIPAPWIPLSHSLTFLLRRKRLLGLSLLLFCITALLTWAGYQLAINFVDSLTTSFFHTSPDNSSLLGWVKHAGWLIVKWLYLFITRIVSFYLAFLIAYTLTTPGYVLLSTAAEKLYAGDLFEFDEGFTLKGVIIDLFEGFKIACFGIIVTILAIGINFVPIIGQLLAFLLYTYYSALMFLDYPSSRRRWSLSRKIRWIRTHSNRSFRLGVFPAIVSMVPLLNIFLMALLFPLLTIHATLNFTNMELQANRSAKGEESGRRN